MQLNDFAKKKKIVGFIRAKGDVKRKHVFPHSGLCPRYKNYIIEREEVEKKGKKVHGHVHISSHKITKTLYPVLLA